MIGAMSCSVLYVHLYFSIGIGKGEGDKYSPAVMIVGI